MKREVPLTPEQRLFAAKHHDLVYEFLRKKQLSVDEFYDVVIFGYLRAVHRFLTLPELQKYSFKTIAWKGMEGELCNHNRICKSQKRNAFVVGLHMPVYEGGLSLEETIAAPNPYMLQLEEQLLLHELAKRVSKQQMNIVRLKSYGYNDCDIARQQNITTKRVQKLLKEIRKVLLKICYS